MTDEWHTETVGDLQREGILLVEDGNHGEYRPRPDEFVDNGVAFIRAADMDAGEVLFESASKINERARKRITKGIGAPGDVLLSHKGTVGKIALVPDDAPAFVCSPQTTFWRALDEERLDRKYLYAFLRSPAFRAQLATRSGETDMAPYVSLTSQRGLFVILPPINTQHAIARILSSLDDKIELNRHMNETLEAMAHAIFKYWFVDFDPVRAKAEGREPEGMDAETAAFFPDCFEETELETVPKGWMVKTVGDILELAYGKALIEENRIAGDIPVFGSNGQVGWHNEELVKGPGIIVGRKGNPGIVTWSPTDFFSIDTTFYVILKSLCKSMHYVFYSLRQQDLASLGADSAVPGLNRNLAYTNKMVVPSPKILETFDKHMAILKALVHANEIQSYNLSAIRDALLPKLLSGEIEATGVMTGGGQYDR